MEIEVQHLGIRYTLDVYSDEDGDFFTIVKIESECLDFDELSKKIKDESFEVQRLGHQEVARIRQQNRLDFEESRAA